MKQKARALTLGAMALIISLAVSGSAPATISGDPDFDGHWWSRVSLGERAGFVAGFYDCYTFDVRSSWHFEARSLSAYRDSVSAYFDKDSTRLADTIVSVLPRFADRPGERPPKGGEIWNERHSYFDGDYWRQAFAAGGVGQQRCFVEGYLACARQFVPRAKTSFLASSAAYVTKITRWYGFDAQTTDMTASREKMKIADVLGRFRERK